MVGRINETPIEIVTPKDIDCMEISYFKYCVGERLLKKIPKQHSEGKYLAKELTLWVKIILFEFLLIDKELLLFLLISYSYVEFHCIPCQHLFTW